MKFNLKNREECNAAFTYLTELVAAEAVVEITEIPLVETAKPKKRTNQQNKSLHKFFDLLALELNSAGLDMRRTLKPDIDIPWTSAAVKEFLWRPIQNAQLNKESTTELTTKEIDLVYETLMRYLGEKHGITVLFPSIDDLLFQNEEKNT